MRIDHRDTYEHVPKDANTAICIYWTHTDRTQFVVQVADKCTDEENSIQRAILVFQEGISYTEAESISKEIREFIEGTQVEKKENVKIDFDTNYKTSFLQELIGIHEQVRHERRSIGVADDKI